MKVSAVDMCSEFGVSASTSVGNIASLTESVAANLAAFMVSVSLKESSYSSSICLICGPDIEGGVMTLALNFIGPSHEHAFSILAQFCGVNDDQE